MRVAKGVHKDEGGRRFACGLFPLHSNQQVAHFIGKSAGDDAWLQT
ncbi:MAG: hypothetical protein IMW89_14080 [Ktedonobacteraceae bacterium]|nr:hypothetical protein [Ktedonobacteraceae bacterium]